MNSGGEVYRLAAILGLVGFQMLVRLSKDE
jgi:hypothetical protein